MTERDAAEAEIRSTAGEAVGTLRILSEGITPLTQRGVRELVAQAQHALEAVLELAKRLP